MVRRLALTALAALVVSLQLEAQPGPLRFEVASIKPNKAPLSMITANQEPGGRFVATNQSLKDLIGLAHKRGPVPVLVIERADPPTPD